ncbi:hypothetical protein ACFVIY_15440 [Streptomyces sp. NPDC127166]|uniref:hypothetical protein n=1 Tax=Streptomyces sp. NPDC127166 TaxID=3345380 RepID=UPI0036333B50
MAAPVRSETGNARPVQERPHLRDRQQRTAGGHPSHLRILQQFQQSGHRKPPIERGRLPHPHRRIPARPFDECGCRARIAQGRPTGLRLRRVPEPRGEARGRELRPGGQ